MDDRHDPEVAMWHATIAALLARRYPHAEAFENASLLLAAYRRRRVESRDGTQTSCGPVVLSSEEGEDDPQR
jgi:hypothetical protein